MIECMFSGFSYARLLLAPFSFLFFLHNSDVQMEICSIIIKINSSMKMK